MRSDDPVGTGPQRAARLEVGLLGHPRFTYGGLQLAFGGQRKTLPILAYLLIHREAQIARDFLAYTMWPDVAEDVALANLRRTRRS
jgi:DNA-binding SARP family transcriptional activator